MTEIATLGCFNYFEAYWWLKWGEWTINICYYNILIDWLFIVLRPAQEYLYGDVTITGEGLQNLDLCSALRAFEQGGIFIVPHLLWHGASVYPVSSDQCLLRHTRGCGGPILTRVLTGCYHNIDCIHRNNNCVAQDRRHLCAEN
jgi:hypothetical protein